MNLCMLYIDLNAFYSRFDKSNFSAEKEEMVDMVDVVKYFTTEDIEISVSEVRKLFTKLNSHKAKGPGGASSKVLKLCANQLAFPFQKLFQTSISTGTAVSTSFVETVNHCSSSQTISP